MTPCNKWKCDHQSNKKKTTNQNKTKTDVQIKTNKQTNQKHGVQRSVLSIKQIPFKLLFPSRLQHRRYTCNCQFTQPIISSGTVLNITKHMSLLSLWNDTAVCKSNGKITDKTPPSALVQRCWKTVEGKSNCCQTGRLFSHSRQSKS